MERGLLPLDTEMERFGEMDLLIEKRNGWTTGLDVQRLTRVGEADLWWWWWSKKVDDGEEKLELVEEAKDDEEDEELENTLFVCELWNLPDGDSERKTGPLNLGLEDEVVAMMRKRGE